MLSSALERAFGRVGIRPNPAHMPSGQRQAAACGVKALANCGVFFKYEGKEPPECPALLARGCRDPKDEIMEQQGKRADRQLHIGKPSWLKTKIPTGKVFFDIKKDLRARGLVTVCEEAKCPNIGECWSTNTATFMVLGDTCTRACRFCNVKTGNPAGLLDANEPQQVAKSCRLMGLRYVVITMVDRDDLPDGGAAHVARVVEAVKGENPGLKVELLAGDFRGSSEALTTILATQPEVYAHNLETVERLSPRVRDARAQYRQSLASLARVKELATYPVLTKSALMLGLGETFDEVVASLVDMRQVGVDFVTIGQYMRPSRQHLSIKEWVKPEVFAALKKEADALGFLGVASAPLVRSSYRAHAFYQEALARLQGMPAGDVGQRSGDDHGARA